ncbi:MAG: hypothetical protein JNJ61_10425 [Anaerolineae bacterium]|nr:hypothetical protein [Anaerolineae bacterium]
MEDRTKRNVMISAVIIAVIYGVGCRLVFGSTFTSSFLRTLSNGFLIVMPIALGALTVYLLRNRPIKTLVEAIAVPFVPSMILMLGVVIINLEATICVIMASPLFLIMSSVGGAVMYLMLRAAKHYGIGQRTQQTVLALVLIIPYLVTPLGRDTTPLTRSVVNRVEVNADADAIWAQIIRVPEISEAEQRFSLFHVMGIPRPLEATLEGNGVGAVRHGIFEYGLSFEERITEWQPGMVIEFDIDVEPSALVPAPLTEIGGRHFDVLAARYEIEPLNDGRSILHLKSTYQLTTEINFYASLWADLIMQDFQQYVLEIVKRRAEAGSA